MENTNDKSFVNHNSNKPLIRTMEDDLKKIKNSSAGNNGAASILSSLASASFAPKASHGKINRPISVPSPAPVPDPVSPVPKNLPVDASFIEKDEHGAEKKTEILKPIKSSKDVIDSSASDNRVLGKSNLFKEGPADEKKEEKNTPILMPIAPVSISVFSKKSQSEGKPAREIENLSPEARLARQTSLGISDGGIEPKESLAAPPSARIFSDDPGQSRKSARPFNSISSALSFPEGKRKSIEEIIKEDGPSSFFGKFIKLFFAVLIIAGIAAGAYYLYIVKKPADNSASAEVFVAGAAEVAIKADLITDLNN